MLLCVVCPHTFVVPFFFLILRLEHPSFSLVVDKISSRSEASHWTMGWNRCEPCSSHLLLFLLLTSIVVTLLSTLSQFNYNKQAPLFSHLFIGNFFFVSFSCVYLFFYPINLLQPAGWVSVCVGSGAKRNEQKKRTLQA